MIQLFSPSPSPSLSNSIGPCHQPVKHHSSYTVTLLASRCEDVFAENIYQLRDEAKKCDLRVALEH